MVSDWILYLLFELVQFDLLSVSWSSWFKKDCPLSSKPNFLSVSFPFGIASNLLVLFYWQEIFDKRNMKLSPFLRRLVVPFLVFVALVVLLDLAGPISKQHFLSSFVSFSYIFKILDCFWTNLMNTGSITRGFDLTLYYPTIVIINALIYDGQTHTSLIHNITQYTFSLLWNLSKWYIWLIFMKYHLLTRWVLLFWNCNCSWFLGIGNLEFGCGSSNFQTI